MKAVLPLSGSWPGLSLCIAVSAVAIGLERMEASLFGKPWLESLVIAILLGGFIRTLWRPAPRFDQGIDCAAKTMLELAVASMGATVSFGAVMAAGVPLLLSIVVTVVGAIGVSFIIGRAMGLPGRMAMLVACGNAICGNSAIAAVAPVIRADSDDVATSIAFTAVLGIVVVISLPLLAGWLHLTPMAGGILAGLTVYAVPQVLAAAAPMGSAAVQIGTLVKLVRVLMLGPIVAVLSLLMARRMKEGAPVAYARLMPPFILVFLGLATIHSLGWLPQPMVETAHHVSGLLTVLAMAGLGLGVDFRDVALAGPRVTFVVTSSLLVLGTASFAMLWIMGIA
ncbi:MAG: putative sulfate exporter family transporter [Sphingobium sp.]